MCADAAAGQREVSPEEPHAHADGPVERLPHRDVVATGAEDAEIGGAQRLRPPVVVPIQMDQELLHSSLRRWWHPSIHLEHLSCILRKNRALYRIGS